LGFNPRFVASNWVHPPPMWQENPGDVWLLKGTPT
jgi:hypothetical protein